ncbi:thioredoxin domain-containing protein [Oricola cellulosilytica]|uniref:thioredoxin domain-containing protein n=1 Tax=Oricola cellulosilytica TaxID=1429082 RepID=UPI001CBCA5A1|nr:thioredoxin domain-containing protein [Oricola cellulosilytica]
MISANRLGGSTSPYLLQHKDNPVHWQEWEDGALQAARDADRPILLSIGYAACHWCHVMAHECFEDNDVAELMNSRFVNIKVDREERPDLDQIYMAALTAMGEHGGWPLTMALTPDGKPFWGGTYFPKHSRCGRPGFIDVLNAVSDAFQNRRAEIESSAKLLKGHLTDKLAGDDSPVSVSHETIHAFTQQITALYDSNSPGLRGAPKFPSAPFLEVLWRGWRRTGDEIARNRFLETVTAIATGGIYDHVGGGIARYTVDENWLIPHFEKMLYDNAHFIRHCLWAHAETGEELFRMRIDGTIAWLEREMTTPAGGFAASLDADSEGEEGKYYVWTASQIAQILSPRDATTFRDAFGVTDGGNWEGKTILNLYDLRREPERASETVTAHDASLRALLEARQERIPPGRDTKVLADWNGFAIRGIAEAGRYFGSESWQHVARSKFDAILTNMLSNRRLAHVGDGRKRSDFGFATDYAAMINAAISLYEVSGDECLVDQARELHRLLRVNHYDHESKMGYLFAEHGRSDIPISTWNDNDDANPSATAQVIEALTRLSLVRDDGELDAEIERITSHAAGRILANRYGQAGFINSADSAIAKQRLVVSGEAREVDPLWTTASKYPDPRRTDIFIKPEAGRAEFGGPRAYLCTDQTCSLPVRDPAILERLLRAGTESG